MPSSAAGTLISPFTGSKRREDRSPYRCSFRPRFPRHRASLRFRHLFLCLSTCPERLPGAMVFPPLPSAILQQALPGGKQPGQQQKPLPTSFHPRLPSGVFWGPYGLKPLLLFRRRGAEKPLQLVYWLNLRVARGMAELKKPLLHFSGLMILPFSRIPFSQFLSPQDVPNTGPPQPGGRKPCAVQAALILSVSVLSGSFEARFFCLFFQRDSRVPLLFCQSVSALCNASGCFL